MTAIAREAFWRTLEEILALPVTHDCCPWDWDDAGELA